MKDRVTKEKIKKALETKETMRFKDCADSMITILEELGAEEYRAFDINGWQYDFWVTYTYNGDEFMIWGSGYYGTINIEYMDDLEDDE